MKKLSIKNTAFFILVGFIFFPVIAAGQVKTYDEIYDIVKTVPPEYQEVIDADFSSLPDTELFRLFITVSNDKEREAELLDFYTEKAMIIDEQIKKEFPSMDFLALNDDNLYKLADALNRQMHLNILKAYNKNCFTTSELKDRKLYDCVSASLLYSILLKRYNIPSIPVETPDHVLIKITLPQSKKQIDVETTNYYGFDPGTKTEFQANYGKTTGFAYVSPVNYKRRSDINMLKLYSLVVQNSISILTSKKDYLPAAQQAYILKEMRHDEEGDTSYKAAINNLTNLMVYENNQAGNYEQSFTWIQDFPDNQNKRAFLNNTYLSAVTKAEKVGDYQFGFDTIDLSLQYGIKKNNTEYIRFRRQLTNNLCVEYIKQQQFDDARKLIDSELTYGAIPKDDLYKLLKSTTISESNYLYFRKQYKEAITKTIACLEIMPKDKILVNNLKKYYVDYADYLKTADPKELRAVIAEARRRFPNEKAFEQLVGSDFEF